MNFLQTFLNVLIVVSQVCRPASATERGCGVNPRASGYLHSGFSTSAPVPWLSLWGTAAEFTSGCSHWTLKPHVSIPGLQEFTVCFHLQLTNLGSWWTAFMYRHPDEQYTELGVGRKNDRLVVWLFGEEWTAQKVNIELSSWHSLCVTWSHVKDRPAFYVNGKPVEVSSARLAESSPSVSSLRRQLAASGSLTLAAPHYINNGSIVVQPYDLPGKLSLFRMWSRERSAEEVTSLMCTEGDLVKWKVDDWDTQTCAPIQDPSLQCEWSYYEVGLIFMISRHEGNDTELSTARDVVHNWLRSVLPSTFYLHTASVFEFTKSDPEDLVQGNGPWATPIINRFRSVVHLSVSPSLDVAAVQNTLYADLKVVYKDPGGVLDLLADTGSIYTTPVEGSTIVPTETPCPSTTVTTFMPTSTPTATPQTPTTSFSTPTTSFSTPTTTFSTATTSFSTATTSFSTPTTSFSTPTTSFSTPTTSFSTPTSVTSPANISDLYFQVKTNVTITSDYDPEQTISAWLNSTLPDDLMMVLDLELLPKHDGQSQHPRDTAADAGSPFKVSRDSCIFQVQVMRPLSDAQKMEEQIRKLLQMPYNDSSVSIVTEDIEISRILVFTCDSESQQTRKGLFVWPDTPGGRNVTRECPKNSNHLATRHCKLRLSTHWIDPDLEDCPLVVETIPDLDHVKVTSENALDILEMIEDLLRNHSSLNYQELVTVLNKLEDIINLNEVTRIMGQALIDIISDLLESESNLVPFTNTILNITEAVGDKMLSSEGSSTLVAPAIAMSVVNVGPGQFEKLTFGVSSDQTGTNPEIYINENPFNGTVAFISLPPSLQHSFPEHDRNYTPSRVHFQFFGIPLLFMKNQTGFFLNTFVVSASVTNASSPIKDLREEVTVILHHLIPNTLQQEVHCVYWNYNINNGQGGWDDYGCRKHDSSPEYTTCLCNHLTHFGVLMDVSRTPLDPYNEQILTVITYVGCGVSSLFLGVTVLTYTAFDKLRRDYPSQILINLSLALLGLNLVFLINSWLSSWGVYGLCVAIASLLHYFLLASFTWMGLEAVNMYFALVKVFNVYVPSYILKFCALGWGLPLVVCILVLIVNRGAYGSHIYTDAETTLAPLHNSDHFCWLQDDVTFYVSVVAYGVLILLFNIGVFIVVLIQIRRMRANSPAGTRSGLMQDLKGVSSLTLLLGLTWTAGFFTWGPGRIVLLYLFAVLNTLQGLFIFLFHCLMKENVRKQWRIHLCFGRFRLDEYSEWSNSASVRVQARSKPPKPRRPSIRSIKSSSTDSTSASSNSSQRDTSCKRPDLGLFVNPPALPRAQRSPAGAGAQSSAPGWRNHFT